MKEHIDEETDDLDDGGIPDIFDDDIDGDGRIDNTPAKWWSPDTGISGGEFSVSEVTQDNDSDIDGGWSDKEDTVHYDWSAAGGSVTPDSNEL